MKLSINVTVAEWNSILTAVEEFGASALANRLVDTTKSPADDGPEVHILSVNPEEL